MKLLFLGSIVIMLASPTFARAEQGHWSEVMHMNKVLGFAGNYQCAPTKCTEADPALSTVNCKNLSELTFAYNRPDQNGSTSGYVWLGYDPAGPTADDWALSQDFTIDGIFSEKGFQNTGIFKDPAMGSSKYVNVKSFSIDMLPPEGKHAQAIIDFGGRSPIRIDLQCCTPGIECGQDTAQARQPQEDLRFTESGIEAVDSDKTFQSAKNSAMANAKEHCSPNEAKRVSEWDYKITKAGYLFMMEVSATFVCKAGGQ